MIHITDIVMYFILVFFIGLINTKSFKGNGITIGCITLIIFTLVYCTVFYFYDWMEIFKWLDYNVTY